MKTGFFVAGTDTGVGKTAFSAALLRSFAALGLRSAGMKPVAAGCTNGRNEDVEALVAASSARIDRSLVCPYLFEPPIAPHIAASEAGVKIDLAVIEVAFQRLQTQVDVVVVEGVGGFRVPLNEREDAAGLARRLGLPVILVVGLRLGCLNHALLTRDAIAAEGLKLAGWVANRVDRRRALRRGQRASSSARAALARARLAVSPGDSMPKKCTRPGTPCRRGPWIWKSGAGSPGPAVLGRMPE
jgi:dethiobiotin synthetase